MFTFNPGDAVAVLPIEASSPLDTLSIATVSEVNSGRLRLIDGRQFQEVGGQWSADERLTYIEPATPIHIKAVHAKCMKPLPTVGVHSQTRSS